MKFVETLLYDFIASKKKKKNEKKINNVNGKKKKLNKNFGAKTKMLKYKKYIKLKVKKKFNYKQRREKRG